MNNEISNGILDKLHRLPKPYNESEFISSLNKNEQDYLLQIRENAIMKMENIGINII